MCVFFTQPGLSSLPKKPLSESPNFGPLRSLIIEIVDMSGLHTVTPDDENVEGLNQIAAIVDTQKNHERSIGFVSDKLVRRNVAVA